MARIQAESVKPQGNVVVSKVPDAPKHRKQNTLSIFLMKNKIRKL